MDSAQLHMYKGLHFFIMLIVINTAGGENECGGKVLILDSVEIRAKMRDHPFNVNY